jgi:hypothetical protein
VEPSKLAILYDCDICGGLHRWEWDGDCREDANRFSSVEDFMARTGAHAAGIGIEVRDMEDRVTADAEGS